MYIVIVGFMIQILDSGRNVYMYILCVSSLLHTTEEHGHYSKCVLA